MKLQDKLTISDLADSEFQGKRVLIRVDFNVPQNKETLAIENTAVRLYQILMCPMKSDDGLG